MDVVQFALLSEAVCLVHYALDRLRYALRVRTGLFRHGFVLS
jgi:hypothetical protein